MFTDTQPFLAAFWCTGTVTRDDAPRSHLTVILCFMRKEGGCAEAWESPLYPIQLWGDFVHSIDTCSVLMWTFPNVSY